MGQILFFLPLLLLAAAKEQLTPIIRTTLHQVVLVVAHLMLLKRPDQEILHPQAHLKAIVEGMAQAQVAVAVAVLVVLEVMVLLIQAAQAALEFHLQLLVLV
jgi:hypothetical protein